jgi:hypothetical protein
MWWGGNFEVCSRKVHPARSKKQTEGSNASNLQHRAMKLSEDVQDFRSLNSDISKRTRCKKAATLLLAGLETKPVARDQGHAFEVLDHAVTKIRALFLRKWNTERSLKATDRSRSAIRIFRWDIPGRVMLLVVGQVHRQVLGQILGSSYESKSFKEGRKFLNVIVI